MFFINNLLFFFSERSRFPSVPKKKKIIKKNIMVILPNAIKSTYQQNNISLSGTRLFISYINRL